MILAAIVAVEALCDIRDRLAAPVRVECECVRPLTIGSEQGETTDGD